MEQRYDGITITFNEDIGAFEDWLDDGSGLGGIDLDATRRRYVELISRAMEEQFPGADICFRFTNGGGRERVTGDAEYRISEEALTDAKTAVLDEVCPGGSPENIIVLKG